MGTAAGQRGRGVRPALACAASSTSLQMFRLSWQHAELLPSSLPLLQRRVCRSWAATRRWRNGASTCVGVGGSTGEGSSCLLCALVRDATLQVVHRSRPRRAGVSPPKPHLPLPPPFRPPWQRLLRVQWDQHRLQPLDSEEGLEEKHAQGVLAQRWGPGFWHRTAAAAFDACRMLCPAQLPHAGRCCLLSATVLLCSPEIASCIQRKLCGSCPCLPAACATQLCLKGINAAALPPIGLPQASA